MDDTIIHPQAKTHVTQFVLQPSHAILLTGPDGVGKTHVAEVMAAGILQIELAKLAQHPYYRVISGEKGSISIDAIRELQHLLQLKTLGKQPIRRVIIVEHANTLTTEAQNAYLKLLEEPPADTVMILTADNQRSVLPTISSRVQLIPLHTPEESVIKRYFQKFGHGDTDINQAYFLSGGLPGLMHALLEGDDTHPLSTGVNTAKEILQKPVFERLAMVDGLSKQRDGAVYAVAALQRIVQIGLDQAASKDDANRLKRWHRILKTVTAASDALSKNANTKLVLSNLMLQI